jgi:membrane protease YdiL (CAAX protease family)
MTSPTSSSHSIRSADDTPVLPRGDTEWRPQRSPLTYTAVLFGLSYALQFVIILGGGLSWTYAGPLMIVLMFLPGLLALLFLGKGKTGWRSVAWGVRRPRYLLYGALLPAGTALLCIGVIGGLGWGTPTHWHLSGGQVVVEKGGFVLGTGAQGLAYFAANYGLSALLFSVVNGLAAFGEELGWRGYLQDRLVRRYGKGGGITLLGLVWGFWHFPLILTGYNYPELPVLGALVLFPLTTIFASFMLAWLTTRAKSLWPAVLAHGSVNTFYGYIVSDVEYAVSPLWPELLIVAVWGLVAAVVYRWVERSTRS